MLIYLHIITRYGEYYLFAILLADKYGPETTRKYQKFNGVPSRRRLPVIFTRDWEKIPTNQSPDFATSADSIERSRRYKI